MWIFRLGGRYRSWAMRLLVGYALTLTVLQPANVHAQLSTVFKDPTGIAIEGYDAIAYSKDGKAIEGSQRIRNDWNGASWYFTSRENRDLFQKDPWKYAPQYGGYCAFALATTNQLVPSHPEIWKIIDGRLYLFANTEAQKLFAKRVKKLSQTADKNWKSRITPGS